MSHDDGTLQPAWADRIVRRNDACQLQLGLDEALPLAITIPDWEGVPDVQRADVVTTLARLLATAGLIPIGVPSQGPGHDDLEQRSA